LGKSGTLFAERGILNELQGESPSFMGLKPFVTDGFVTIERLPARYPHDP
jgi:hypothetical protein